MIMTQDIMEILKNRHSPRAIGTTTRLCPRGRGPIKNHDRQT
jgi:hypothetical protein